MQHQHHCRHAHVQGHRSKWASGRQGCGCLWARQGMGGSDMSCPWIEQARGRWRHARDWQLRCGALDGPNAPSPTLHTVHTHAHSPPPQARPTPHGMPGLTSRLSATRGICCGPPWFWLLGLLPGCCCCRARPLLPAAAAAPSCTPQLPLSRDEGTPPPLLPPRTADRPLLLAAAWATAARHAGVGAAPGLLLPPTPALPLLLMARG
jgi:hypothetical protein